MLKLIINNAHPLNENGLFQELEANLTTLKPTPQDSFLVDFQEFSPNLYVIRAQDLYHELACEMNLELKESFGYLGGEHEEEDLVPVMFCDFPCINIQNFNEKLGSDKYLQEILMFLFHLKILAQLFLFCEEKDAVNLILTIHDAELNYLEIYRRFFISEEEMITSRGKQTQIVIPTDVDTYDEVIDFMDEVEKDFRQILWREQKVNPIFRDYLKGYSLSVL